jgi:hypothetical protein
VQNEIRVSAFNYKPQKNPTKKLKRSAKKCGIGCKSITIEKAMIWIPREDKCDAGTKSIK